MTGALYTPQDSSASAKAGSSTLVVGSASTSSSIPVAAKILTTRERHSSLAVLLGLGVVCALDAGIMAALLTPIKASLRLTDESFGQIAAAFTIAGMLGAPIFGYLAGRFGRKSVLIGAIILWSIASSLGAIAAGFAGLMLWRGLTGFGEAAYQGLAPSWISDLYDRRWRNFVFSLYMVRNKIGTALSLALGGWLAAAFDWHVAFLVSGIPGILLAAGLIFQREPVPGASDGYTTQSGKLPFKEQMSVLKVPAYVLHLVALAFFFSGSAIVMMWVPPYLSRIFGMPNQDATSFLAAVLLFTTPVGLIGGFLAGRYLTRFATGLMSALAVTSLITGGAFAVAFLTRDVATARLFITIAIIAFGSTAGSLTTLMVESAPPHLRAAAGSIGALVSTGFAGVVAPWALGFLSDRYGLEHAIFLGAGAYALAGVIWTVGAIRLSDRSINKGVSRP